MVSSQGPDTLILDVDGDCDGTLRRQYTAVNARGAFRTIFVNMRPDNRTPPGTSLRIRGISIPAGCGSPCSEIVVSDRPAGITTGIPSCAMGRGSAGALVEYRLCFDDSLRLRTGTATSVTLVFTISDDS
jgi:hypothetical protein